jgi:hypothetical protein
MQEINSPKSSSNKRKHLATMEVDLCSMSSMRKDVRVTKLAESQLAVIAMSGKVLQH